MIVQRLAPDEWELLRAVRLAALLDAPEAFASSYAQASDLTPGEWEQRARDQAWFVAVQSGEAAAVAAGSASYDGQVHRRDLTSMWVHPAWRGHGIADLLIGAVRDWALLDGARELVLWVADGNADAEQAYARAGFVPTGRRQPLASNPEIGEEEWVLSVATG